MISLKLGTKWIKYLGGNLRGEKTCILKIVKH